jgi:hypothetical protein
MTTYGSFTANSDEGTQAVIDNFIDSPDDHYPIEFNRSGFEGLVRALAFAADSDRADQIQLGQTDESLAEWASSFLSDIASTLDIELI